MNYKEKKINTSIKHKKNNHNNKENNKHKT